MNAVLNDMILHDDADEESKIFYRLPHSAPNDAYPLFGDACDNASFDDIDYDDALPYIMTYDAITYYSVIYYWG